MKTFTDTSRQKALALMKRYPSKSAALLPLLHMAQKEFGCIDEEAEKAVAELMGLSPISVREASQFYFMYHPHPVGKYHLQVCHNITCTMMGAETILDHLKKHLGIEDHQRTEDGLFSVERVECLACCDRGPALFVNEDLHTELTPDRLAELLADLRRSSK